jgi:hypothetical protein
MVKIQRPALRGGARNNSSKSIVSCRNFLLAVGALLVLKFLTSSSTADKPADVVTPPLSMVNQLKESQASLRKKTEIKIIDPPPQLSRDPPQEENHAEALADFHKKKEKLESDTDNDEENTNKQQVQVQVQVQPQQGKKKGSPIHDIVLDTTGTGPTKVGYVKDFVHEQAHPDFRANKASSNKDVVDRSKEVAALASVSSVKPCLVLSTKSGSRKRVADEKCEESNASLIVYNPASFPRSWCGSTNIPPQTAVQVQNQQCDPTFTTEPVHIFAASAKLGDAQFAPSIIGADTQAMPPIIIKSHDDAVMADSDLDHVVCDVPCLEEKGMEGMIRYIDGQPTWKITQTMLDPWNYNEAKIDRTDYRNDHYYSTQSWLSSIPLTVFNVYKHNLRNHPAVGWDTAQNKAIYLVNTSCASLASRRNKYFNAVNAMFSVDAIGTCHHSLDVPTGHSIETPEGRIRLMKEYRIVLAFDANTEKDHISEVVWEAFLSGAVPVVVGADNMREHMPPHSMIFSGDYKNWDELAVAIKTIANDKTTWESYHAWRTDEKELKKFEAKYEFTKTSANCRVCRWAYAKQYGLGWDHAIQRQQAPKIPRTLCIASEAPRLVSSPFEESYVARFDTEEVMIQQEDVLQTSSSCTVPTAPVSTTIEHDSFKVHRTVVRHDGLTDLIITGIEREHTENGEISIRLVLPVVKNSQGAFFRHPHTLVANTTGSGYQTSSGAIQDEHVKVTVLADWETELSSPQEGVLEVVLQKDKDDVMIRGETRRIRIITEDMSLLHDKMTEYFPSSFAMIAIEDFINPLELYHLNS